jgi:hypothetical protein
MEDLPVVVPTKPSKLGCVGFVGTSSVDLDKIMDAGIFLAPLSGNARSQNFSPGSVLPSPSPVSGPFNCRSLCAAPHCLTVQNCSRRYAPCLPGHALLLKKPVQHRRLPFSQRNPSLSVRQFMAGFCSLNNGGFLRNGTYKTFRSFLFCRFCWFCRSPRFCRFRRFVLGRFSGDSR